MKKAVLAVWITVLVAAFLTGAGVSAYAATDDMPVVARVMHPDTPLYDEAGELICRLDANVAVEIREEREYDYVVVYNGQTGILPKTAVYFTRDPLTYPVELVHVKSERVGVKVKVYATPSADSPVVKELTDGTAVRVAPCGVQGYLRVFYGNEAGYVRAEDVTEGLSRNQTTALSIGLIAVAATVIIALLAYRNKNRISRPGTKNRNAGIEHGDGI